MPRRRSQSLSWQRRFQMGAVENLAVGQLAVEVHDDALGLTALAGGILRDPCTGKIRALGSGDEEVTFFREANDEFFLLWLPI